MSQSASLDLSWLYKLLGFPYALDSVNSVLMYPFFSLTDLVLSKVTLNSSVLRQLYDFLRMTSRL